MLTRYRAEALSSGEWESVQVRERERGESGRVAQEKSGPGGEWENFYST